jgi:hypothetical protein
MIETCSKRETHFCPKRIWEWIGETPLQDGKDRQRALRNCLCLFALELFVR